MKFASSRLTFVSIGLFALTLGGCVSKGGVFGVDRCADVPRGAIPEPVGTKLCQWQTEQIQGALADRTVLYRADFVADSTELSPGARERLSRLLAAGQLDLTPITVEPSGNEAVDQARVSAVVTLLASVGMNAPDVSVAIPSALGLTGPAAERAAGSLGRNRSGAGSTAIRGGLSSGFSGGVFP